MTPPRSNSIGHFAAIVFAALAVLAFGFGQSAPDKQAAKSNPGGAQMNMPGMNMPGMEPSSKNSGQPSSQSEVSGHAVVSVSPQLQQEIGVRVGEVERGPLKMNVRTLGIIRPDETKLAKIHLKVDGWIEKLFVDFTGQTVRKGDSLLAIYSPQFLTTQQEYMTTRKASANGARDGFQNTLAESAIHRLELWDVPREEIDELEKTGKPHRTLTLRSPLSGTVLKKDVFEREYVTADRQLYEIADLATVWVQAKVYEYELPHVELNQPATVTVPALPEQEFTGKVVFIQPTVEEATRTIQVRVELPNKEGLLRPGMFAHIKISHTMGDGLLVPTSAVIRTGERDIAYRMEAQDRFVPVEIKVSALKFGENFQVVDGLKAGDRVVTSANFLIDSESRLRMGGGMMPGMNMGDMKGMKDMKDTNHSQMKH